MQIVFEAGLNTQQASERFCPCFDILLLSARPPGPTLEDQERQALAEEARARGWGPSEASDAEALASLRGRGGRSRQLRRGVQRVRLSWDRRAAVDEDLRTVAQWIHHLREVGVRSAAELRRHLQGLGVVKIEPADVFDVFDDLLRQIQPALGAGRYRGGLKWSMKVLAALSSCEEEAIKKQRLRRYVDVRTIVRDLNELRGR